MSELRESATVPLELPPTARDEPLLLSYAQRRLWFLQQVQPGASEAYNIPLGLRLTGELDQAALTWALDRMVERHEPLRTRIESHLGEGFQRIDSATGFTLLRQDLSQAVDGKTQLEGVMLDEVRAPFVLEKGPLCRAKLIRMSPHEHVLLVTTHHIIADGWSMGVFVKELSVLYDSYPDSARASLPPLTIQYADYAAWQRRKLSGEILKSQVDYWRTVLADAPSVLALPTDRQRPPAQDFSGDTLAIDFDGVLTRKLQKLALRHNTTLFQLILAAWAVVLGRLSGQDQVVIGVPVANRLHPSVDIEGLIGLFVNTLPLRIELPAASTLEVVLSCAARAVLSAHEHAEVPFERIVEVVKPIRSPAHTPLFQVMFAWQNSETVLDAFRGLEVRPIRTPMPTAKYDLTLDLSQIGECISGHLNYATSLFDAATARRHVSYLQEVLSQMTVDMQQRVATVNLLSDKERQWVVADCNNTQVDFGPEQRVEQFFEAQVARTPNAAALSHRGQTMTYAELGRRSNSVARYLRSRGVSSGQLVGLCMDRSFEMVVGLLGILKSAAAYVPIDPGYPRGRQALIVEDAALKIILTQERLRLLLPASGVQVIALDTDWRAIAASGDAPLDLPLCEKSTRGLLYVIYTSGSAGEPKGVEAEHHGTVNRIWAQQLFDPFLADDVCGQKTSIGFVDSIFETLGPLMYGVPLVIAGCEVSTDIGKLLGFIKENRITRLVSVPSLAQAMLERADIFASLATLRTWTLSGEELKGPLLRRLQAALPQCRFVNLYGSSEVAADVTWYVAGPVDGDRVPIGKPLANTQIYILDGFSQPVPVGVTGELHVAGACVARGYHRRAGLSAARFVPDPFSVHSQGRLYKTGDRARWRPDGTIEYLGRGDHQVKIRGVRVELEEIAKQLEAHQAVKTAVVALREDVAEATRLIAYVVLEDKGAASSDELRTHLRAVLPDYMLPNAFVVLQSFPLLPNGKVDRKALPPPVLSAEQVQRYEAPQGAVETALAGIWRRLLNVEPVGRNDNFFELGGHSMRVVELMAGIADTFSIQVDTALVFQAPTIREMAQRVRVLRTDNDASTGVPLTWVEGAI